MADTTKKDSGWSFSGFMDNNNSWIKGIADSYSSIKNGETQAKKAENEASRIRLEAEQKAYEKNQVKPAQAQILGMSSKSLAIIGGVGALALILVLRK